MSHTITVTVNSEEHSQEFPSPERRAMSGDIYESTTPLYTLSGNNYNIGDQFEVIKRTDEAPHRRLSSMGNLVIKTKYGSSIWSCFDLSIAEGFFKLVR